MELVTLKTDIKTQLKTEFIWLSKSLADAFILFNMKSNGSFCPCFDYQDLNNLTIKNRYLIPLIGESLDRLDWAKRFT